MADGVSSPPMAHKTIPSSPPMQVLTDPPSPTSSEPPMFSSDDPFQSDDVTNYISPREKRKRAGPWYDQEDDYEAGPSLSFSMRTPRQSSFKRAPINFDDDEDDGSTTILEDGGDTARTPTKTSFWASRNLGNEEAPGAVQPARKQRRLERNNDSGIHMPSDGFDVSFDDISSLPALPAAPVPMAKDSDAAFRNTLNTEINRGATVYDFSDHGLHDDSLAQLAPLNQLISQHDPGTEVPADGQFRSLVPELKLFLNNNHLVHLHPTLFTLENLTHLHLRNNELEELPPAIAKLRNLKALDLWGTKLRWLPSEMTTLLKPQGPLEVRHLTTSFPWYRPHESLQRGASLAEDNRTDVHSDAQNLPQLLWLAWVEQDRNRDDRGFSQGPIAATLVAYYDAQGRPLAGSYKIVKEGAIPIEDFYIKTARGIYYPMATTSSSREGANFSPPSASAAPSLTDICIRKALTDEPNPSRILDLLGPECPFPVRNLLEKAKENMRRFYTPMLTCAHCQSEYVVPRAEWVEFWMSDATVLLPFFVRVCSWACAEARHLASQGPRLDSTEPVAREHFERTMRELS